MSRYTRCISSDKASRDVWSDVSVSMILSDKMVVGHDSTSGGRNSTASTKSCIQAAECKCI